MEKTFYIDIQTPPTLISDADFRLYLIRDLVKELRKYENVEIINEEILTNFLTNEERKLREALAEQQIE